MKEGREEWGGGERGYEEERRRLRMEREKHLNNSWLGLELSTPTAPPWEICISSIHRQPPDWIWLGVVRGVITQLPVMPN